MHLHPIALALRSLRPTGSFVARETLPPEVLVLAVKDVGELVLPVSDAFAHLLTRVARPATFGRGEETLRDPTVRDAWVIPPARIKLDRARWNEALAPALVTLGRSLGLPPAARLHADLHDLLVYEPGQFFKPHQDSERSDDMVGTLLVLLPGTARGGAFVIEHGGERRSFSASRDRLTLVAFYADCRHEVQRVKQGHRVVLTFELRVSGGGSQMPQAAPAAPAALVNALRRHFDTPVPSPVDGRDAHPPPDRLVFLLDHEYSSRSLAFDHLKNGDALRCEALRAAAEALDCDWTLALVEAHETRDWLTEDPGYGGWSDEDDDDDGDRDAGDDDEGGDLIDADWTLTPAGGSRAYAAILKDFVREAEVVTLTDTRDFDAFRTEREGNMGNWGNTVDRWYHRAAFVCWPRSRTLVIRGRSDPAWALARIATLAGNGDRAAFDTAVKAYLPWWSRRPRVLPGAELEEGLRVAAAIDDPAVLLTFLKPFALADLRKDHAAALTALAVANPAKTYAAIVGAMQGHVPDGNHLRRFHEQLPALAGAVQAQGASTVGLFAKLLDRVTEEACIDLQNLCTQPARAEVRRLLDRDAPSLAAVLEAATVDRHASAATRLVDTVTSPAFADFPELAARLALAHLDAGRDADVPGLDALRTFARRRLRSLLSTPPRSADDWSIMTEASSSTLEPIPAEVIGFLRDPKRRVETFRLAEAKRVRIQSFLERQTLPVAMRTDRTGRTYGLVVTKSPALHTADAATRREREDLLRRLDATS